MLYSRFKFSTTYYRVASRERVNYLSKVYLLNIYKDSVYWTSSISHMTSSHDSRVDVLWGGGWAVDWPTLSIWQACFRVLSLHPFATGSTLPRGQIFELHVVLWKRFCKKIIKFGSERLQFTSKKNAINIYVMSMNDIVMLTWLCCKIVSFGVFRIWNVCESGNPWKTRFLPLLTINCLTLRRRVTRHGVLEEILTLLHHTIQIFLPSFSRNWITEKSWRTVSLVLHD